MARIVAVLACFACMGSQSFGLRQALEGKSNASPIADARVNHSDNGGVDGAGAMSLKSLASLLMVANAAQPSMVRGLMQPNLQFAPSPISQHLFSHRSRAKSPYMAYDREEAGWTNSDDRMLRHFAENMKGPVRGPVRAVIHGRPSPWLLIFNEGKPNEGVYTLEDAPNLFVAAFESEADAERFGTQLHASDFDHPTPTKWPVQQLTAFCEMQGFQIYYVPDGTLVFPPGNNKYDVEAYSKAHKGEASERASLERMFMPDAVGQRVNMAKREDVAKLERMFRAGSHGSQNSREANLKRRFKYAPWEPKFTQPWEPAGRHEVANPERKSTSGNRGIPGAREEVANPQRNFTSGSHQEVANPERKAMSGNHGSPEGREEVANHVRNFTSASHQEVANPERKFTSSSHGSPEGREEMANLERKFTSGSHGSLGGREEVANLERKFTPGSRGSLGVREEVANVEHKFMSGSHASQKRDVLTRFMRHHRSKIVAGKFEEVLKDLPVGWMVLFNPGWSVDGHPFLAENDPWRRWLLGVPKLSALVFEDQEDAKLFVDQLNSEELSHTLGRKATLVERIRHARWEVQRWENDLIRAFCTAGPFGVALVPNAIFFTKQGGNRMYLPSIRLENQTFAW